MKKNKKRQKIIISDKQAVKFAQEWFKQKIPPELLVKFNRKEIVHAHSYGGLSKFFLWLQKNALMGTKCWNCGGVDGNIWLPPRMDCPDCWGKMIWLTVNPEGAKVYTHSMTNYPGAGFKGSVPCPLISVEIPGVCTKIMSYLSEFGEGEPYIGMPVKPIFRIKNPTYTILDLSWVPVD